ncbi:MAG: hypothetical protein GF335_04735 [Candidatus Moranbacteria bacterium]|nr:hypothetical protein [Candidatus Moranbacteria bacterium]
MKIINKRLTLKEFEKYIHNKKFGSIKPSWLVIHHTWRPTQDQWQGGKSILGIKNYYEKKGWRAGPHLFIAKDGIWLFTDMDEVGIHAGKGNALWKNKYSKRIYGGYVRGSSYELVGYSVGIEVVGNYDNQTWSGKTLTNTVGSINILKNVLNINNDKIKFHRDYSNKSCPGWAITKKWLFSQLDSSENIGSAINDLKVYDFWKKADPLFVRESFNLNHPNFDAQYKIKNLSNRIINIDQLALAVHDSRNHFVSDLADYRTKKPRFYKNIRLKPKESLHFDYSIASITKPGKYKAVAKAKINNRWYHLEELDFTVQKNRFSDKESMENLKIILDAVEKKLKENFGSKLTNTEKDKIIKWIESKKY